MSSSSSSASEEAPTPMGDVHETDVAPIYPVPVDIQKNAYINSMSQYKQLYDRSIKDPQGFWGDMARENLSWFRDFKEV